MTRIKTYSEMCQFDTREERFEYLKLGGTVGHATFGFDRYLNQRFYASPEWKRVRDRAILRDNGCDLGVAGYELHTDLLVHHMNPISVDDIIHGSEWIVDPEFLITTCKNTHNAIHYGDKSLLIPPFTPRMAGDTKLW